MKHKKANKKDAKIYQKLEHLLNNHAASKSVAVMFFFNFALIFQSTASTCCPARSIWFAKTLVYTSDNAINQHRKQNYKAFNLFFGENLVWSIKNYKYFYAYAHQRIKD